MYAAWTVGGGWPDWRCRGLEETSAPGIVEVVGPGAGVIPDSATGSRPGRWQQVGRFRVRARLRAGAGAGAGTTADLPLINTGEFWGGGQLGSARSGRL